MGQSIRMEEPLKSLEEAECAQVLRSEDGVFDDLPDRAAISVIQNEFSEKPRRPVRRNEDCGKDRELLGQNMSRENLEKTIQIARRFAAVRTN